MARSERMRAKDEQAMGKGPMARSEPQASEGQG
jgi:hypothetical protein